MHCTDAFGNNNCKVKLVDDRNSCWGTVLVECHGLLEFYFDENGNYAYFVLSGDAVAAAAASSSAQEEGVVGNGTIGGLRGAKGSSRLL
jgi:hypothetical protein